MKMKVKFVDHGKEDVDNLLEVLPNISDDHWYSWNKRNEPTIPFVFMPNFTPPHHFEKIKYFRQPQWLEDIILPMGRKLEDKFNARILKLMLIAVEPEAVNGYFHTDPSDTLLLVHRCHMPLVQSNLTCYHVGGEEFPMEVGHWYEKDNTLVHAVINYEEPRKRRISLQCDLFPLDNSRFEKFPNLF